MEDYAREPVAFDMGISTLTRINYWLWKCNEAQFENNIDGWFNSCKNLYKELDVYLSDKELEVFRSELRGLEKEYERYLNYVSDVSSNPNEFIPPPRAIFDKLFNFETKIRRRMDKEGLIMRRGESALGAMV